MLSPEAVMAEIEPALPFIRGITVSGGECTLYPDFLRSLGIIVKEQGKSFFLDTNGSYDFTADPSLLDVIDGVMLDIKALPDPESAKLVIRRETYPILSAAEFLAQSKKLYEVRTVISPGLFDAALLVDLVCRRLVFFDPPPLYKLIRYRPIGVRPEAAGVLLCPTDLLMDALADCCKGYGIKAVVV
jgi:pyruvate formate lyase activating enzyme